MAVEETVARTRLMTSWSLPGSEPVLVFAR